MGTYKVRNISWGDDSSFDEFPNCYDAEDAIQSWCKHGDSNSWFVDGYPDSHEMEVQHPDGSLTRHIVSTDWSPDFYVHDKD